MFEISVQDLSMLSVLPMVCEDGMYKNVLVVGAEFHSCGLVFLRGKMCP